METGISAASIRRLAAAGHLQYIVDQGTYFEKSLPLSPDRIAADDAGWDIVGLDDVPGAYIDTDTGELWRVVVHMGNRPEKLMRPGEVRTTLTGYQLIVDYLPRLVMTPIQS